jgi:N-acetylglucosamine-6-sulfatase
MYADAEIERRPSAGVPPSDKPVLARQIDDMPALGPDTVTPERDIRGRLEMLMAADESLGRILETLEARGELDNTVVVFTSDHGYFYGEHGLSSERRLAYEETIRIPLLVRYPSLAPAGTTHDEMTLIIDLAPTFLELGGEAPDASLQGRSLLPVFAGQADDWRTSFLVEYFSDTVFQRIRNMGYQAVRTDRYKYIHYTDLEGMDELYDLVADPYELTNIIDDPAATATLEMMRAELAELLRETGDSGAYR